MQLGIWLVILFSALPCLCTLETAVAVWVLHARPEHAKLVKFLQTNFHSSVKLWQPLHDRVPALLHPDTKEIAVSNLILLDKSLPSRP
jgi:hypothetical protein